MNHELPKAVQKVVDVMEAVERHQNPLGPGTIVKGADGRLYRTCGHDGRTLKSVSAKLTKAERKRWKKSRHALRAAREERPCEA